LPPARPLDVGVGLVRPRIGQEIGTVIELRQLLDVVESPCSNRHPRHTQAVAGSEFGLFLVKELWLSNYAKSDLRYTCGAHQTGDRL
jgi:hypothetical protein